MFARIPKQGGDMLGLMPRLSALPLLLLAACTFDTSSDAPPFFDDSGPIPDADPMRVDSAIIDGAVVDAATIDGAVVDAARPDAALPDAALPDAALPDAEVCIGDLLGFDPLNMDRCDPLNPIGSLTVSGNGLHTLNTGNGVLTDAGGNSTALPFVVVAQAGGPDLFVTTATNFTVSSGADLIVIGTRPFAMIATETISIDGRFGALGLGILSGPGGNLDSACLGVSRGSPGEIQSAGANNGGSGGGGGGFAGPGGQGARVNNTAGANSPGGAAAADLDLVPLRGGCSGGNGGNSGGGAGGGAGGAIQLVAGISISHNGSISVSGGGGRGVSNSNSGGGGGGSGGGLLLQSPSISGSNSPTAGGGGGGEGSRGYTSTSPGSNGSIDSAIPATGGGGSSLGGNGGNGGTPSTSAGNGSTGKSGHASLAGGGGGGGGGGRIVLITP